MSVMVAAGSDIALSGSFLVFVDSSAAQSQVLLFHYGAVK